VNLAPFAVRGYFPAPPPVVPVPPWLGLAPVAGLVAVLSVVDGFAVVVLPGLTCVLLLAAVPAEGFIDCPAVPAPPTF
jgi:hypothetical protein